MKKTVYECDGCLGSTVTRNHVKSFFSEKYDTKVDLCVECQGLLVEYVLKKASVLRFCQRCQGRGVNDGERVDTPCCGENRPEYRQVNCEECGHWKKAGIESEA